MTRVRWSACELGKEEEENAVKSFQSFATSSLKIASAQRIMVDRRKKHIQNYLLTNDAENVMNNYPFLDLLL